MNENKLDHGLIPLKNALICWKREFINDRSQITKLEVIYCPFEDKFANKLHYDEWKDKESARLKRKGLSMTYGCVNSCFSDLPILNVVFELFHIFLSDLPDDKEIVKEIFFEFGKIKELSGFRDMYWQLYLQNLIPYSSVDNSFYGWDFCLYPGGTSD